MKKIIYAAMFFLAITMMCGNAEKAEAKAYKAGKFKYQYKNTKKGVWITKITPLSSKGISKLNIPAKVKGKKVVKLGNTNDKDTTDHTTLNLFGVRIGYYEEGGIYTPSNPKVHKRVAKIKKIRIPDSVVSITPSCFFDVQEGKEINIPKSVKKEGANQFTRVKWKKVKISSKNKTYKVKSGCLLSKNGKILYGLVYKKKRVVVPKTVTEINTADTRDTVENSIGDHGMSFRGCEILVLPKSVKKISIFSYSMMKVEVDSASKYFASKDGSVYSKKDGTLVWLYQTDGIYNIPDGVKEIPYDFGTYGKAKKIIIPASVKKVSNIVQYCGIKAPIIVCNGKEPPTLLKEQTNSVVGLGDEVNVKVYVPKGCKDAYEKTWVIDKSNVSSERINFTFIEQ